MSGSPGDVASAVDSGAPPADTLVESSVTTPSLSTPNAVPALTDADADARVTGASVRIELVSAGVEPRRLLRHSAVPGNRASLTLSVGVGMSQSKGGDDPSARAVPGFSLDTSFVRAADGWRVTIEGARPDATGDAEQLLAEEVAPLMRALERKTALFAFDARVTSFALPPVPAGLDLEAAQLWSSVEESVRELALPVPSEAVGAGASWRATGRRSRAGTALVRVAEYTLAAGPGVVVNVTFREEPVATKRRDPLLPPGFELTVRSGIGEGRGKLEFDADLTPKSAEVELASLQDLAIQGPGAAAPEYSTLRLHQKLRAVRKP